MNIIAMRDTAIPTLNLPGKISRTGWVLPQDMALEDWVHCGEALEQIEGSVQWWLGDWWAFGTERKWGEGKEIADKIGVDYHTIRTYANVSNSVDLSIRMDNLSFGHHQIIAPLEPAQQKKWLALAEKENLSVAQLRATIKQERRQPASTSNDFEGCVVSDLDALISAGRRFGTIYADPPWLYSNQATRAATGNHYDGLTVDALCELPVVKLAEENCHLHLWTTNGFLFDCTRIFEAWGFEFRSTFVWVKPKMGIGNYWRNSHELLLTAIRGPDAKHFNDHSMMSWVQADRKKHSAKPPIVREFLERASDGPYLELFGRKAVKGWTVWGNEVSRNDLFNQDIPEFAA